MVGVGDNVSEVGWKLRLHEWVFDVAGMGGELVGVGDAASIGVNDILDMTGK